MSYKDTLDSQREFKEAQEKASGADLEKAPSNDKAGTYSDPYGTSGSSSGSTMSFRQRGDVTQKRVGGDTRVRDDANSGTAGAGGSQAGDVSMANTLGGQQQQADQSVMQKGVPQNASWQQYRQPVDLNTVRQNLMNALKGQG